VDVAACVERARGDGVDAGEVDLELVRSKALRDRLIGALDDRDEDERLEREALKVEEAVKQHDVIEPTATATTTTSIEDEERQLREAEQQLAHSRAELARVAELEDSLADAAQHYFAQHRRALFLVSDPDWNSSNGEELVQQSLRDLSAVETIAASLGSGTCVCVCMCVCLIL
jgi:hypothetical protein